MDNVLCKATSRSVYKPPKETVGQPASRPVSQHLLVLAIRKNFLSVFSSQNTWTHTQTHTPALARRDTSTRQSNGFFFHTLFHFGFKQAAALSLKPHVLFNRCFSFEYQMGHLQSPGIAPAPMYSVM